VKILLYIAIAIAPFTAAHAQTHTRSKQSKKMEQELIIQQIKNLFAGVDARDWNRVKATMDKQVLLDYSSMTGNPAATLNAQDIVDSWSSFLPGFDSTHHTIGGFVIKAEGSTATAHLDGTANHYINTEVWTVEGSYDVKLMLAGNE